MGGKKATSTSQVSIPPEVLARYNAINTRAEAAANKPYESFGTTASDYVAPMNAQQGLGTSTINNSSGPASAGIDKYITSYTKNVADTTGAYLRQQQEQAQSGALGTAASSGAFGGDRAGIAAANLQQQNQMAYGKTMADIMNQGYTQALGASQADLNRGLQAGQMQLAAGTMQQQTEQAGKDALIKDFMQKKGYDFQTAQYLAGIALGTGAASGSTTTSTQPLGFFGNLAANGGRINGYAEGGGVAGPMSHIEEGIGGLGYIPESKIPDVQLMIAQPPEEKEDKSGDVVSKVLAMIAGGKKDGGAISARHGYATDGYVGPNSREEALARYDALLNRNERSENLPRGDRTENLANDSLIALGIQPLNDSYMPPQGGVAPARPMPARPISLTPQSATTPARPMPARPISLTPPQGGVAPAFEMPDRPISLTPRNSLAPTESPRPLPRPASLAGGADIAADTMSVLNNTPAATGVVVPTVPTGVVAPTVVAPQASPQTDTGEIPQGGYKPIVPVKTQVLFQLQEPEYQEYRSTPYATAADAATGMDVLVERSGGAGRKEAAMYAESIAEAAQNGDFSKFPPRVGEIYNQLISEGVSPIHAAGTVGRYMVESYVHIDPNARNTLGGGMGTYGIAQWRGDRMKALAEFAGVPLESLANAPVSTPEGRYYSTGANYSGGLGGAGNDNMAPRDTGGLGAGQKPYEERNAIGKFFNRPEGGLDPMALKSLFAGLGAMANSRSISPFTAMLQGLAGGSDAYNTMQNQEPKRVADILANDATARLQYKTAVELGETKPYDQYVRDKFGSGPQTMVGGPSEISSVVNQIKSGGSFMGVPLDKTGGGLSMPIQLPDGSGTILASQSYAYNSQLAASVAEEAALGIPFAVNTLAMANANMARIEANGGKVPTINGGVTTDPTYEAIKFGSAKTTADVETTGQILQELPTITRDAQDYQRRTDDLAKALSEMPSTGTLAPWLAKVGNTVSQIGFLPESDAATGYEKAYKVLAEETVNQMNELAGKVDTSTLSRQISSSNPTPEMTPRAIEHVLAVRSAVSAYMLARSQALNEAVNQLDRAGVTDEATKSQNLAQVSRQFAAANNIADFMPQAEAKYAGMIEPIMPQGMNSTVWSEMSKEDKRAWIASESQGG